jgi:hypothetical protein
MENQNTNQPQKSERRSVGGLWRREDKNGSPYYFGRLELNGQTVEFRCFKNRDKKAGEKTPDLRMYLDGPRGVSAVLPQVTNPATVPKPTPAPKPVEASEFI